MIPTARSNLLAIARFLRTPTLSRSVVGLLTLAIVLLLAINLATFVMIRRTVEFNNTVERGQSVRMAAKDLFILIVDAETGQRGFVLTGREDYLQPYDSALLRLPEVMDELARLTEGDPDLETRVEHLRELTQRRLDFLERTLQLARTGRIGEAVQLVRAGEGKAMMDAMRAEMTAIDEVEATRLVFRTRQSEWGSNVTVLVNALAGLLILLLAGISVWLVQRYVEDLQQARDALDRMNAGLENQVRERTSALTRANEEIQRFAYIVSHDLRAPLVNVMGYTAELDQARAAIDGQIKRLEGTHPKLVQPDAVAAVREDVPEAIGFIRASTAKMDRLINAILKLSREGRRTLTPQWLDMAALCRAIADSVNHQTASVDAEIVVEPLPELESDRFSIEQIFGNLIDNAVKYLAPDRPGRIVVSGEESDDDWVIYRVADNGRGISERDNERIFELFRRSGKQDQPGEGLGLAFVRNSVRRLGGSISVESQLGKGSTFTLKFPKRLNLSEAGDHP